MGRIFVQSAAQPSIPPSDSHDEKHYDAEYEAYEIETMRNRQQFQREEEENSKPPPRPQQQQQRSIY